MAATASSSSGETPFAVHVLLQSTSPKLMGIAQLLRNCSQKALTVVRGTESQRHFNLLYSEFCRSALIGVKDLETEMSRDDGGAACSLSEQRLLADVACFISQHSHGKLTALYLEHLGAAVISQNNMQQRALQERVDAAAVSKAAKKRPRPQDAKPTSLVANTGLSRTSGGASPVLHPSKGGTDGSSPPLQPSLKGHSGAAAGGTAAGAEGKLTQTPAFVPFLMPWTLPLPYTHGIALDRVTVDRRDATSAVLPREASGPVGGAHSGSRGFAGNKQRTPTLLEICCATSTHDMLQMWEERDSALQQLESANSCLTQAASSFESPMSRPAGSFTRVASSPSGGVPLKPVATRGPSFFPRPIPSRLLGEERQEKPRPSASDVEGAQRLVLAKEGFDANSDVEAAPHSFLVQLVHFGVNSVDAKKAS